MLGLSREEVVRYSRQLLFLGEEAQLKLKNSKILVVGAGGLGSAVLYYLASAGVGKLIVVDNGIVELSNLNRQVLYSTRDVGEYKVKALFRRLRELNPNVHIEVYPKVMDEKLAEELIPKVDLVIDALDNWHTRFILNEYCVKYGKPLIHAGVREAYGQMLVIVPGKGPCLRCLFPREPKEERVIPILGPLPGILGALEALEAIKIITSYGEPAVGKLVLIDGKRMEFEIVRVKRNPECPVCKRYLKT